MFIFTVLNKGSENFLKEEMRLKYPDLKPSYSRKGFITFKNTGNIKISEDIDLDIVFANAYGMCIGKYDKEGMIKYIEEKSDEYKKIYRYYLDEEIAEKEKNEKIIEESEKGERILDVICVSENEYWLGAHIRKEYEFDLQRNIKIIKPAEAPSRAYIKLEEAFIWSGEKIKGTALEIGAAPGGASYSLLCRGFKVFGVDTGRMSEICLENRKYQHINLPMQILEKKDLPDKVEILLCDVNLSPMDTIPHIKRILQMLPETKLFFYTMKLGNKTGVGDIDFYLNMLRNIGFQKVKAIQLPSNHSEIFVICKK